MNSFGELFEKLVAVRIELRDARKRKEVAHDEYQTAVRVEGETLRRYAEVAHAIEQEAAVQADDLPPELTEWVLRGAPNGAKS